VTRFVWPALILCLIILGLVACGGSSATDDGKVQVVTTLPLFADFIREVGGEHVDVTALVPSGADPHTYEPAPKDLAKLAKADLVIVNGVDLEPFAKNTIEPNVPDDAPLIELASPPLEVVNNNPHLWMDIANARQYVQTIRDALVQVDPANRGDYESSTAAYLTELDALDAYVRDQVALIPEARRKLITSHDAFVYLAKSTGLEVVGFVAESPGQEPSPDDLRSIIEAAQDEDIPAVFTEPQVSTESQILDEIANDAGVEVCKLYSDSLDNKVKSYVELMRYDADELARCLGASSGG
jgi:zinc/manganese transport system substrate-binding protein/manganese/iron transport system substrate-binding protein